jgi:hypothetical protein
LQLIAVACEAPATLHKAGMTSFAISPLRFRRRNDLASRAKQALANQPVDQLQSGRELHKPLCRVIMPDERVAGRWPLRD